MKANKQNRAAALRKMVRGRDKSIYGAFPCGTKLRLEALIPRLEGASDPTLELWQDEGTPESFGMVWNALEAGRDVYSAQLSLNERGLYFCRVSYSVGSGQKTVPNALEGGDVFQLTVYDNDFTTPEWFHGGIMYQIFPDRFFRAGKSRLKKGATLNPDWYGGIPQYGEYPGAPVANNEFFGGDLRGITEKLDYIASLGVNCIYLNPIFEAASNHKYDTGDYMKIDSMFGGESAFRELLSEAKTRGIHVILDGVFNHTGADSRYFNKFGSYDETGAYQSRDSKYAGWYRFRDFPDDYECWWGVDILPSVNEDDESFREFINGKNGVVRRYLGKGTAGWRLDVADELPDAFISELRSAAKSKDPDALIIGEVWEDASNKLAYGVRRKYLLGNELDSVMNYPLKDAIISFVTEGDSEKLSRVSRTLYEHYPKCVSDAMMNILGTHDTERILTVLGAAPAGERTNTELSVARMTPEQRALGSARLKAAYLLLAALPGIPCIYYGDEAGIEGYRDPFNRRPYPWGREDAELIEWYRLVGALRRSRGEFADGEYRVICAEGGLFVFKRDSLTVAVNAGASELTLCLAEKRRELLSGELAESSFTLPQYGCAVFA